MDTPPPKVSRTLMAAVIIMGVLIVLGTAGLIGVIVHRAMSPGHHKPMMAAQGSASIEAASHAPGEAPRFIYGGGGRIVAEAVRPDGSVAVQINGPQGDRIVIWNPESNQVTAQFTLTP
ncbi:hypothetical protein HW537_08660 [Asaia siamensis]